MRAAPRHNASHNFPRARVESHNRKRNVTSWTTRAHVAANCLLAGTARNAASDLPPTLRNLLRLERLFDAPQYAFYEDGSTDATRALLHEFCAEKGAGCTLLPTTPCRQFDSAGQRIAGSACNGRLARITHARGHLLHHALRLRVPLLIMLDLDEVNHFVDIGAVRAVLADDTWDVATANQVIHYYDRFALRTANVPENEAVTYRQHGLGAHGLAPNGTSRLRADGPPLAVWSAFGGLGLYRMRAVGSCRYVGDGSDLAHRFFHECLRSRNGARITIQPRLLNRGYDGVLGMRGLYRNWEVADEAARGSLDTKLFVACIVLVGGGLALHVARTGRVRKRLSVVAALLLGGTVWCALLRGPGCGLAHTLWVFATQRAWHRSGYHIDLGMLLSALAAAAVHVELTLRHVARAVLPPEAGWRYWPARATLLLTLRISALGVARLAMAESEVMDAWFREFVFCADC